MKHDIKITDIDRHSLSVAGVVGERNWVAAPFRWGDKMLMKLNEEFYDLFDRGEKITIGRAAKHALSAAGLELPEAKLVRPRNSVSIPVEVKINVKAQKTSSIKKEKVSAIIEPVRHKIEVSNDELQSMRLMELLSLAEDMKINVPNGARKDEIIALLTA